MAWLGYVLWIGGYGGCIWAAKKRRAAAAALCFWDGLYLAFVCFAVLPPALETLYFYAAAAAAGLGVAAGFLAEGTRLGGRAVRWAVFAGLSAFCAVLPASAGAVLLRAALGGVGLYHASCGIVPEEICIGRAFLSAAGFLLGVACCFAGPFA